MNILNSRSRLSKLKLERGYKIATHSTSSAYVLTAKVNRYLKQHIEPVSIKTKYETPLNIRVEKCVTTVNKLDILRLKQILALINSGETFDTITSTIYELKVPR